MQKNPVPPSKAYRLLNPGPVVLVSVGDGERDNLFALTWNMPIRKDPGMVAVLVGKRHHSYAFIERTGELGINIPDASLADAVLGCGTITGARGVDKFERFALRRQAAQKIRAPLVAQALANLECRVVHVADMGTSALLVAQVLAAQACARRCPGGDWCFEGDLQLIHHLGGKRFGVTERMIVAQRG